MDVNVSLDLRVSSIAAAIGEPARAKMLFCLLDGRARTSTELAVVAEVSQSTASEHLRRLAEAGLVRVVAQGKHRYYSLQGLAVGEALEKLSVLGGSANSNFTPTTPSRLRTSRTCYDHLAGVVGVALHDHFFDRGWLERVDQDTDVYTLTGAGESAFGELGLDIASMRASRRRLAFGCLDWSERRFHLGGGIGAAFLALCIKRKWMTQDLDSRAIALTALGKRELRERMGFVPA